MAYGFNLGQIEGLDSSVKTITLTIANATESNTYTLKYDDNAGSWTDDIDHGSMRLYYIDDDVFGLEIANFKESDVGDTYNVTISTSTVEENFKLAVETVLVDNGLIGEPETLFDGTITITAEDTGGVEIPFDVDVSSYPFEKWTVTVNGLEIPYQAGDEVFEAADDNIAYVVFYNGRAYVFQAIDIQDESSPPAPGDYHVKITGVSKSGSGSSGLPDVSASDNGSVLGVVNGKWGVDDRLNAYPSLNRIGSGNTYGFRQGRDNIEVSSIIPLPITAASAYYEIGAFYLPHSSQLDNKPHYIKARTNPPFNSSYFNICLLVSKDASSEEPSFEIENTLIPKAGHDGVYTLKATVSNGAISLGWVLDT